MIAHSFLFLLEDHYGESDFYDQAPTVSFEDNDDFGYFDPEDNEIILCNKALNDKQTFIRTMIHEYTHYLQDPEYVFSNQANLDAYENENDWNLFSNAYDELVNSTELNK